MLLASVLSPVVVAFADSPVCSFNPCLCRPVIDFGRQHVITKDTVQIDIDALVYFRITDPRVAVLNIQVRRGRGSVGSTVGHTCHHLRSLGHTRVRDLPCRTCLTPLSC